MLIRIVGIEYSDSCIDRYRNICGAADRRISYCVRMLQHTELTWEWRRLLNVELYDM